MIDSVLLIIIIAFLVTKLALPILITKFTKAGITGIDVHKSNKRRIPEMGGLAIVVGLVVGILFAISLSTLGVLNVNNPLEILASVVTILLIAIIGIFDDLVSMPQKIKATLPIIASIPLIVVAAGSPTINLPFFGALYLPIIYPLIFVPIGVAIFANLTNMLAGFNGLEAGLGLITSLSLSFIAILANKPDSFIILISLSSALLAFLIFNSYPSKIFIGDVGTLTIGATLASAVVLGNFEFAGIIIMIPFILDFLLKAINRFPKEIEYTYLEKGLIQTKKVVGLPSLILRYTNGMSEIRLVRTLLIIQVLFGLISISLYM